MTALKGCEGLESIYVVVERVTHVSKLFKFQETRAGPKWAHAVHNQLPINYKGQGFFGPSALENSPAGPESLPQTFRPVYVPETPFT
jgi:hypothetical protein